MTGHLAAFTRKQDDASLFLLIQCMSFFESWKAIFNSNFPVNTHGEHLALLSYSTCLFLLYFLMMMHRLICWRVPFKHIKISIHIVIFIHSFITMCQSCIHLNSKICIYLVSLNPSLERKDHSNYNVAPISP